MGFWEKLIAWLGGGTFRPLLGLAALLAAAAPAVLLGQRAPPVPSDASPRASLVGIVGGRFHGKPFISRRTAQREQLRPGEELLIRFRLAASAAVHLSIAGPKSRQELWADGHPDSEPQPQPVPAGEHALVADGQVRVLKPLDFGSPMRVTLLASPKPFPAGFDFARLGADAEAFAKACRDCSRDVLEILPPPEGVEPEEAFR